MNRLRKLALVLSMFWVLCAISLSVFEVSFHRNGYFSRRNIPKGTVVSADAATFPDGQVFELKCSGDSADFKPWEIDWENNPQVPRQLDIYWAKLITQGLFIPLFLWGCVEIFIRLFRLIAGVLRNLKNQKALIRLVVGIKTNSHILKIIGGIFFVLSLVTGVLWICGADVEPVAFVLGLIASTFFSLPSIARFLVPDRKAVREMSAKEILNFILATDVKNDWKRVSTSWVVEHYLLEDPRLRFRCRFDDAGVHCENFNEPWAVKFPDPHATSRWHELYYDSGLIERFILVSVDGARTDIPMPSITSPKNEISRLQYHVAKIYDYCGLLDEYIERCGLKISQPVE